MAKLINKNWHLVHDSGPVFKIMKRCSPDSFQGGMYTLATVVKYGDGYRYAFPDGIGERGPYSSQKAVLSASYAEFEARKIKHDWRRNAYRN